MVWPRLARTSASVGAAVAAACADCVPSVMARPPVIGPVTIVGDVLLVRHDGASGCEVYSSPVRVVPASVGLAECRIVRTGGSGEAIGGRGSPGRFPGPKV